MSRGFALVDCNNFYASCERLFRPDLKQRPVVILSNNDGCVVARSAEAKALGIAMGVPYFRIKQAAQRHKIAVFSSNYALYADISSRVLQVLEMLSPSVDAYSIDEAFVDIAGIDAAWPLMDFGQQLKTAVTSWTGIPVCVGMAPTRTLAKLANHAAKRYPATGGVVDLSAPARQRRLLAQVPVGDVWGVGKRLAGHLNAMGITTALMLADTPPGRLQQRFSVVLERTRRELNGESCCVMADASAACGQLISSRSFGRRVTSKDVLRQALAEHVATTAARLREQRCQASIVTVSIRTSFFTPEEPRYSNAASAELRPTDDTRELLEVAGKLLGGIWRDGYRYAKAGVALSGLGAHGHYQPELFDTPSRHRHSHKLMAVMDRINNGSDGRVFFAGQGTAASRPQWRMQRNRLSPAYTTRWSDLAVVK